MLYIPKRRKSKDNPYNIIWDNLNNKYYVTFKKDNKDIKMEISKDIFNAFNEFELKDISQMHEYERHIEHSELYEYSLNERALIKQQTIEEQVEIKVMKDLINFEIEKLPEIQKRRIKMYYFQNLKLREIAKIENCSIASVKESIDTALFKLRKKLK